MATNNGIGKTTMWVLGIFITIVALVQGYNISVMAGIGTKVENHGTRLSVVESQVLSKEEKDNIKTALTTVAVELKHLQASNEKDHEEIKARLDK